MLNKNQIYEAVITDYTSEGLGVAHIEGCAVFIPNAIAGERVLVKIEKANKTWAAGKLTEILEKSPHRVNRECPVAKLCGGCDFWHMDYEEESRLKAEGIPSLYEDKEPFFAKNEIRLALCLLNTVNNPLRDIYLAGLLRSPIYRFTLDELVTIRGRGSKDCRPLYYDLCAYMEQNPDFEKGKRFLSDLAEFRVEQRSRHRKIAFGLKP